MRSLAFGQLCISFFLPALALSRPSSAPCPRGFEERPGSGECYLLSSGVHDFVRCQRDVCGPRNSTLATITGEDEHKFLAGLAARRASPKLGAFLGLYSTGADHARDWAWADGSPVDFAGWLPHQPDNFCGHENCVVMLGDGWNDIGCHVQTQCLCKLGSGTSGRFEVAQHRIAAESGDDYRGCGPASPDPVVVSVLLLTGLGLAISTDLLSNRKVAADESISGHSADVAAHEAVLLQGRQAEPAEAPHMDGSRIDTSMLSGVRAVLMMTVAVNHFCVFFHPRFHGLDFAGVLQGGGAVTGFFCLSGFVMAVAYAGRDFSGDTARDRAERRNFYVKRFARLAPLYYFSLLLDPRALVNHGWLAIPLALTTLTATQSWIGEVAFGWNGPLWSVSTIAFFYLRLPFLMPRVAKWQRRRRAMHVVALLMFLKYLGGPAQYMKSRSGPADALGLFLLGALTGQRRAEAPALAGRERALWAKYADRLTVALGCWLALAGVLAFRAGPAGQLGARMTVEATIALPFCYWLEAVTVAGRDAWSVRVLSAAVLRRLGSWSYGVYCLQMPVWGWITTLKGSTWGPRAFRPHEVLPAIAALVLAAWLATAWIEKPLQKWIQRKLCVPVPRETATQVSPGAQSQPPLTPISVIVPSGALPGTVLQVAVPQSNQVIQVQVPPDAAPGAALTVRAALPDPFGAAVGAGTCRDHWSPESGRCLCMDPQASGDFSLPLFFALSCPCCIPRRECCCFNPCNPRAGCGNCFADWQPTGHFSGDGASEDVPPRQEVALQDFSVARDVRLG